jgi:hypothetical protein
MKFGMKTNIWTIEDLKLLKGDDVEVLCKTPVAGDDLDAAKAAIRQRMKSAFEAQRPTQAVRLLDPEGREVYRYTVWEVLAGNRT